MYEPHAMHEVQHGISVLPLYDTSDLSELHFMHGMRFFKRQKNPCENSWLSARIFYL